MLGSLATIVLLAFFVKIKESSRIFLIVGSFEKSITFTFLGSSSKYLLAIDLKPESISHISALLKLAFILLIVPIVSANLTSSLFHHTTFTAELTKNKTLESLFRDIFVDEFIIIYLNF